MTPFDVYLFTRLDALSIVAWLIFACFCITALVMAMQLIFNNYYQSAMQKYGVQLIIAVVVSLTIAIAVPTSQQAAIIYVLPKIINNEDVQQLPSEVVQLARKKIAELMAVEDKK